MPHAAQLQMDLFELKVKQQLTDETRDPRVL